MSDYAACACLTVRYNPEEVSGQLRERWVCDVCGCEFIRYQTAMNMMVDRIDAEAATEKEGET